MIDFKTQVTLAYVAGLGRAPDKSGFEYWVNAATSGNWDTKTLFGYLMGTESAYGELISSGTNQYDKFIQAAYKNLMGREPDKDGFEYWKQTANSSTPDFGSLLNWMVGGAATSNNPYPNDSTIIQNRLEVAKYVAQNVTPKTKGYEELLKQIVQSTKADTNVSDIKTKIDNVKNQSDITNFVNDLSINNTASNNVGNKSNIDNQTSLENSLNGNTLNSGSGSSSSSNRPYTPQPSEEEEEERAIAEIEKSQKAKANEISKALDNILARDDMPEELRNAIEQEEEVKPIEQKITDIQKTIQEQIKQLQGDDEGEINKSKIDTLKEVQKQLTNQQEELNSNVIAIVKVLSNQANKLEQERKNIEATRKPIVIEHNEIEEKIAKILDSNKIMNDDGEYNILSEAKFSSSSYNEILDNMIKNYPEKAKDIESKKTEIELIYNLSKQQEKLFEKSYSLFQQADNIREKAIVKFAQAVYNTSDLSVSSDIKALENDTYIYLKHVNGVDGAIGKRGENTYILDIGSNNQALIKDKELFYNTSDHKIYAAKPDKSAIEETALSLNNDSNGIYASNGNIAAIYDTTRGHEGDMLARYALNADKKIVAILDPNSKLKIAVIPEEPLSDIHALAYAISLDKERYADVKSDSKYKEYVLSDIHGNSKYSIIATLSDDNTKIIQASTYDPYGMFNFKLKHEIALNEAQSINTPNKLALNSVEAKSYAHSKDSENDTFYIYQKNNNTYISTLEDNGDVWIETDEYKLNSVWDYYTIWNFKSDTNEFFATNRPGEDIWHHQSLTREPNNIWLLDKAGDYKTAKFRINFDESKSFTITSFEKYSNASTGTKANDVANNTAHTKYMAKDNTKLESIFKNKDNNEELSKMASQILNIDENGNTTAITLEASANIDVIDIKAINAHNKLEISNFDKNVDKIKISNATKGAEVNTTIELTDIKDADKINNAKIKVSADGLISFTKNDGSTAQNLSDLKVGDTNTSANESQILNAIQTALNKSSYAGIANGIYLLNGTQDSYVISLGADNTQIADDMVIKIIGISSSNGISVSNSEISLS